MQGFATPSAFGRAAASPQTRQMRCWPSSERTTNPSSRRKRQDSRSLSLVLFPPKPLRWVSAGALLGEMIRLPFCIFGISVWGWYHYPRRALHAVETLDARGSRRRIRRFYAVPEFALCGQNIPSAGTHANPAPNRAHNGSQGETRGHLSIGHSVALCCQRNCHRKNSRRKWMHALWRVSAFSGVAAPLGCAVWTLLFPQP